MACAHTPRPTANNAHSLHNECNCNANPLMYVPMQKHTHTHHTNQQREDNGRQMKCEEWISQSWISDELRIKDRARRQTRTMRKKAPATLHNGLCNGVAAKAES